MKKIKIRQLEKKCVFRTQICSGIRPNIFSFSMELKISWWANTCFEGIFLKKNFAFRTQFCCFRPQHQWQSYHFYATIQSKWWFQFELSNKQHDEQKGRKDRLFWEIIHWYVYKIYTIKFEAKNNIILKQNDIFLVFAELKFIFLYFRKNRNIFCFFVFFILICI